MKGFVLTAEQSKALDLSVKDEYGIPDRVMIEVAGRTLSTFFLEKKLINKKDKTLVCIGSGHNGCDGLVLSRFLHLLGYDVDILVCKDELKLDISKDLIKILDKLGVSVFYYNELQNNSVFFNSYTLLVDAITGTGFYGNIQDSIIKMLSLVESLRALRKLRIVSLDVPSFQSVDAHSLEIPKPGLIADTTIALQTLKNIHVDPSSIDIVGQVFLVDIGLPLREDNYNFEVFSRYSAKQILGPIYKEFPTIHKGNKSKVVVFGGNEGKEGAAYLSALASLKSGASLATIFSRSKSRYTLQIPEIMYEQFEESSFEKIEAAIGNSTAVVLGPGLGTDSYAQEIFDKVLGIAKKSKKLVVIDADALHILSQVENKNEILPELVVLTPHPKEFLVLAKSESISVNSIEDILKSRSSYAEMLSARLGRVVVLKGARSIVSFNNKAFINPHAISNLAVGGSGDVLSGIIASVASRGKNIFKLTALSVYLHGEAGSFLKEKKHGSFGNLASDIAYEISNVISQLLEEESLYSYWSRPFK